jgi:hypothetical protein
MAFWLERNFEGISMGCKEPLKNFWIKPMLEKAYLYSHIYDHGIIFFGFL